MEESKKEKWERRTESSKVRVVMREKGSDVDETSSEIRVAIGRDRSVREGGRTKGAEG